MVSLVHSNRERCGSYFTRGGAVVAVALALCTVTLGTSNARAQVVRANQPVAVGQPLDALVARVATGAWDTFSTEVTLRRRLLAADGRETGLAPTTERYRWERAKTPAGWKNTTTLTFASSPSVRSQSGAVTLEPVPTIAKVEDFEDGSAPRLWDARGVEVKPPTGLRERLGLSRSSGFDRVLPQPSEGAADATRGSGRAWVEEFLIPASGRERRRTAIGRQFGRAVSRSGGVGRYVQPSSDGQREVLREVLVDERDGVLVGTSAVENGTLVERTAFAYERAPSGALVKRGLRFERLAAGGDATRMVTEIEYSDIRLTEGGR